MKCPHTNRECNKVDTSEMTKESCDSCKKEVSNMIKFTPGPWTGSEEDGLGTYVSGVKTHLVVSDERDFWIALVQTEVKEEEALANHRLILSAPEMFYHLVVATFITGNKKMLDTVSKIIGRDVEYNDLESILSDLKWSK